MKTELSFYIEEEEGEWGYKIVVLENGMLLQYCEDGEHVKLDGSPDGLYIPKEMLKKIVFFMNTVFDNELLGKI